MPASSNDLLLKEDASNRAWRTFLVGILLDVGVAIALTLTAFFATRNSWDDFEWAILTFSLAKSVVQSIGSYVLRRFVDPSSIPTPLPPTPQAQPAEPVAG